MIVIVECKIIAIRQISRYTTWAEECAGTVAIIAVSIAICAARIAICAAGIAIVARIAICTAIVVTCIR